MHIDTGYASVTIHSELILRGNESPQMTSEPDDKDAPENILNKNQREIGYMNILDVKLTASRGAPITTGEYMIIKLLNNSKGE